jgi:hypothetical protein
MLLILSNVIAIIIVDHRISPERQTHTLRASRHIGKFLGTSYFIFMYML